MRAESSTPATPVACARCESVVAADEHRCPVCTLAVPGDGPRRATTVVRVLRCEGCGAATTHDPEAGGLACAFCGSVVRLETLTDPPERVERYVPFTVDAERARGALRRWLGGLGFFRPTRLAAEATITALRPTWWASWVFDAWALVSWAADTDAGTRRASWAPHSGQCPMTFDDVFVSASKGLTDGETAFLAPSYDLGTWSREPAELPGATIEELDVTRSQARARISDAITAEACRRLVAEELPGRRHRKLSTTGLIRDLVAHRYALPAWVVAYRYRDRAYRVVISGQDETVIRGDAPISVGKVVAVVAGGLALLGIGIAAATLLSS